MTAASPPQRALGVLGRWEWVALPELGLTCIQALLDGERATSALRAAGVETGERDGQPVLRFRVHPLPEDPQTFVAVEARREAAAGGGQPVIPTTLTLGEHSLAVALEIDEGPPAGLPMTLGRDVLAGRFAVDSARAAVAGPPRLDWHPRRSPRRRPRPAESESIF